MLYFFHRYELPLYEAHHPRAPTVIDLNGFGIHVVAFVQHNPVVGWLQYQLDRLAEVEEGEGENGTEQQPGEVEGAGEEGGGMGAGEDGHRYWKGAYSLCSGQLLWHVFVSCCVLLLLVVCPWLACGVHL